VSKKIGDFGFIAIGFSLIDCHNRRGFDRKFVIPLLSTAA
jgi:hypothetical protein